MEKGLLDSIVPRNLFKGFLSELFAFHGISHFSEKKEEIYEKRITMFLSIRFMESFWFEPRSTQHRSLKGSSTTHQSTKARIFQKVDSFSRVHNRMDKLTLTRQFWIQLGIFIGRYREEIEME